MNLEVCSCVVVVSDFEPPFPQGSTAPIGCAQVSDWFERTSEGTFVMRDCAEFLVRGCDD